MPFSAESLGENPTNLYWGRWGPEVVGRGRRGGRGGRMGRGFRGGGGRGARQYSRGRGGGGGVRGGGTAPPRAQQLVSAREVQAFPLPVAVAGWRNFAADPKPPPPRNMPTAEASDEVIQEKFERCSDNSWLARPKLREAPAVGQEEQKACADDPMVDVVVELAVSALKALPLQGVGTGSYWLAAALPKMGEALLN
ncbi:hypothetical protein EDC01DRAFT_777398 [Geopyxis carbonaria]|nr:hypothetical protein EDC01DRAFT_777398 [Geopyxis carbonaria]